jgi:hypothetical protein
MNRPPACLRLSDERGNKESYWSGLSYNMLDAVAEMILRAASEPPRKFCNISQLGRNFKQAAAPTSSQDPPPQFETLEDKDRQLREMLEPDFSDQLVYYLNQALRKSSFFPPILSIHWCMSTSNGGQGSNLVVHHGAATPGAG